MENHLEEKKKIEEIVARAQMVVQPKIAPVQRVLDDIKLQLAHGTDRIPTSQLHEWGLVLAIISTEMTPQKEAYALSSAFWKASMSKTKATTVAARRLEKKAIADAENEAVTLNTDKETERLIMEYMTSLLRTTKEDVYMMCSELNRIMDARSRWQEDKK